MDTTKKRILSGLMIAGDFFMVLIALILLFDEELFLMGIFMLAFLAIDVYLTVDYIKSLRHRQKVEDSLKADNANAREIKRKWNDLNRKEAMKQTQARRRAAQKAKKPEAQPAPQPAAIETEEDISDVLTAPAPQNKEIHG